MHCNNFTVRIFTTKNNTKLHKNHLHSKTLNNVNKYNGVLFAVATEIIYVINLQMWYISFEYILLKIMFVD